MHRNSPFELLENRLLMAAPQILHLDVSPDQAATGGLVTIVVQAVDDQAIGAVTAWLDRDNNAQFRRSETDQPLGEVYFPDFGTTDRFTIRVRTDESWPTNAMIVVDAVDVNGEWSNGVYHETIIVTRKPFLADLVVYPDGSEWVARARVSTTGDGLSTTAGVTFFLDQNGNNAWDSGTDIDLGASRFAIQDQTGPWSYYEKRFTPQAGWANLWIGAAAFDARASTDRFGIPRIAQVRDTAATDWALVRMMTVHRDTGEATLRAGSGVVVDLAVSAAQNARAVTLFHDVNRNGMWDYAWDIPIDQQIVSHTSGAQSVQFTFTLPANFVPGRTVPIAAVVQDLSGRGDDAWGPVFSTWKSVVVEAWAQDPVPSSTVVPLGQSYTIDIVVRDDRQVQDVRVQFLRGRVGFVIEFPAYEILSGSPNAARWRVTIPTDDPRLSRDAWQVGIQAYDFEIAPTRYLWTDLTLT